ncbi:unnamed protein product [Gordionus sp. m RMFG-2023]|uniref:coiled-coil-helix-coiled-coil-helix domain-containing protein 10, mitochondrial-like n=1 Tax=Gordionus sp. m RMFG-2023 TaxID=3053472 RepID=UPI0030DFB73B
MPRRSAGRSSPSRSFSSVPARRSPQPSMPVKATPKPSQPLGPGLMAQMGTTVAGVAVGSAIGHTLGHAMTGAFSGGKAEDSSNAPIANGSNTEYNNTSPCLYEMKQFLECSEQNSDLSLCQGFQQAFKNCKINAGYY